jgi:hypothetical protein
LFFLALSVWTGDLVVTVRDPEIGAPPEGVRIVGEHVPEIKTEADGRAILKIPEGVEKPRVIVSLPGYKTKMVALNTRVGTVSIELTIANVVEGTELVVEQPKPQSSDAEPGVSVVASQEQIAATSNIGVVEDVMSTVKSLPGVGYDGSWNALPSIRGGDPSKTTTVLDGVSILYPYHWGG